ncbi:hypothetical protein HDV02_001264 [Globomyces sp. JEL0801]|nr:hypothetical protein HDV02_001264 [Globomyces sp. JEL0801]
MEEDELLNVSFKDTAFMQAVMNQNAFEVGKDNSRFHPVQGYRWVTDEPAIQESRKELVERADQDNILDLQQQHLALNFKNQIDRLIVDSFVKSKLEPEKPVRTDYSQSYASRVNTPVPTSEVVVTPPPFPTKRKKSDGQTGKKKKDTTNK